MASRAKLTLNELKFISLVDNPAQQTAKVLLVKRDKGDEVTITAQARVMKVGPGDNPLIYCWAFTCTDETGQPYHDLQGDAISPDFIKAAETFMASGAASDEMHDENATGRIAFAFPMDADIAKAFFGDVAGGLIKTSGLMIAVRASKDALAKVRSGDYTGVSIAGTGTREVLEKGKSKCTGCGTYQTAEAITCTKCGGKVAMLNAKAEPQPQPDASKTVHVTVKNNPDPATIAAALASPAGQAALANALKAKRRKGKPAKPEMAAATSSEGTGNGCGASKRNVAKHAVMTSVTEGHQHVIDLHDPSDSWSDMLSTSYNTAEGATEGHSHVWTYDRTTGAVTIGLDSGHTHTVTDLVPADVIAEANAEHNDDDDKSCAPVAIEDEPSSGKTVVIVARAPEANSPPSSTEPTVKGEPKEPSPMSVDTHLQRIAELEAAKARLEKVCTLTDSQRAHFTTLSTTDGDVFLSKSQRERDFIVEEIRKADQVVYTSKTDGRVYRKSDDADKIRMAQQIDKLSEEHALAKAAERAATFAKRGDEILKNFPVGAKKNLRGRMMKALNAEFTDAAEYEEAETALKAHDNAMGLLGIPVGISGSGDDATPVAKAQTAFENAVRKFSEQNNISYAEALERGTASDPTIRQLYNNLANAAN